MKAFPTFSAAGPRRQLVALACVLFGLAGLPAAALQVAAAATAAPGGAPEDVSWSIEQYVTFGLPAPDRDWSGQDLSRAATRLEAGVPDKKVPLPRVHSPKSGQMFARLAAAADRSPGHDAAEPMSVRFSDAALYASASSSILKVYLGEFVAKRVGGAELIELLGTQLKNCVVFTALTDELVPTLSKDDPKYASRIAGFATMKSGLADVVAGVLQSLTEEDAYSVTERLTLARYARETVPAIVPHLSATAQLEVRQRLQELADHPEARDLQSALRALRDAVPAPSPVGATGH